MGVEIQKNAELIKAWVNWLKQQMGLRARDRLLLRLLFAPSVKRQEVADLLLAYDIGHERLEFNLPLARLMQQSPAVYFPETIRPRLQGVLRYFHYQNASLFLGFEKIGRCLNQAGIRPLLLKGLAMRFYYPSQSRHMFDVDFAVPESSYRAAVECAQDQGFHVKIHDPHSTDMVCRNVAIDIHHLLTKQGERARGLDAGIWARARKERLFNVDVEVPSVEDLVLLLLLNGYQNIKLQSSYSGQFNWMADCARLLHDHPSISWAALLERARQANALYQLSFLLSVLDELLPGLLPPSLAHDVLEEVTRDQSVVADLRRELLEAHVMSVRRKRKEVALRKCRTWSDVAEWFRIKSRYRYLRFIQKNRLGRWLFLKPFAQGVLKRAI